jgi:putative endonuclease
MSDWNKNTGNKGEEMAAVWLQANGYDIVERNWRFKHWEVDIIASNGRKLHFVEVKTRSNHRFGRPEESIKRDKMSALKNAAEEYLYQHEEWKYIQFDVLAITLEGEEALEIFLIEDVYF